MIYAANVREYIMATAAVKTSAYSALEELLSASTHAVGALLGVAALVVLLVKTGGHGALAITAVSIYGGCMIFMYASSAAYHSSANSKYEHFLKMLDHTAIYFKIAGSYTPFALISLPAATGWWVIAGAWGAALTGTVFKLVAYLRRSGKSFNWVSLALYLLMGWAGVMIVAPLSEVLPADALFWLFAGGGCYTVGAVFYALKSVPYFHTVWHLFVLGGSACHFVAIYCYVV
jgi:hemolysin III